VKQGLGKIRSAIYARMEEMSFRSGAAVLVGVLAAVGVAITLAVVLGGHSADATSAPADSPAARSTTPAPGSAASPAASSSGKAPAVPPPSLMPTGTYQRPAPTSRPTRRAAASPSASQPTPQRPTPTPHQTGQPAPIVHNPGGLSPGAPAIAPGSGRGARPGRDGGGPPGRPPARPPRGPRRAVSASHGRR